MSADDAYDRDDTARYSTHNWCPVLCAPVTDASFQARRLLAEELAALTGQLLRVDADPATLRLLADQVRDLRDRLPVLPKRPAEHSSVRLKRGEATAQDVLMLFDYDPQIGQSHPLAPRLVFVDSAEQVIARVQLSELHQGAPGRAHGGVLAGVLDVVLARVQHRAGYFGVTGQLNIRYLKPTLIDTPLEFRAWCERAPGRVTRVEGGVWMAGEQTVAADGVWVVPRSVRS